RSEPAENDRRNRLVLEYGCAEITREEIGEIVPEPHIPGIVEAKGIPQPLDCLRRRLLSQKDGSRVTWNDEKEAKGHHHHSHRHGNEEQQSADYVGNHGVGFLSASAGFI